MDWMRRDVGMLAVTVEMVQVLLKTLIPRVDGQLCGDMTHTHLVLLFAYERHDDEVAIPQVRAHLIDNLQRNKYDQTKTFHDEMDVRCIKQINSETRGICHAKYSPDARMLATCSNDGNVKIWSTEDSTLMHTLYYPGWAEMISWHPDGCRLLVCSGSSVILWNVPVP
jgi:WD40 repeat protein